MLPFLIAMLLPAAQAAQPNWRWLTIDDGLEVEAVESLAQAADGRIWIGTTGGAFRWDGQRMERADGGKIRRMVVSLAAPSQGPPIALAADGQLWRLAGEATVALQGPEGAGVRDISVDQQGRPIAATDSGIWRWDVGQWVHLQALEGATVVRAGPETSLLVATGAGWKIWRPGELQDFAPGEFHQAHDAGVAEDGSVWLLDRRDALRHVTATGAPIEIWPTTTACRYMTIQHNSVLWASNDYLNRLDPEDSSGNRHVRFRVPSMGPIMSDEEGSLWVGTLRGLGHIPEPEVLSLTDDTHLGVIAGRSISLTDDAVWMGAWQHATRFDRESGQVESVMDPHTTSRVCTDSEGLAWGVTTPVPHPETGTRHYAAMGGEPAQVLASWPAPGAGFHDYCEQAQDGSVLWASAGWIRRAHGLSEPEPLLALPFNSFGAVLRVMDGEIWVGEGPQICSTDEAAVLAGEQPEWQCYEIDAGRVNGIQRTEQGSVWASGVTVALSRLEGERFVPHPSTEAFATNTFFGMRPSPSGGMWLFGPSVLTRVADAPEDPAGLEKLEVLAPRLGHLMNAPVDVVEEADGTLWLAGSTGLAVMPGSARHAPSRVPEVLWVAAEVDGLEVQLQDLDLPRHDSLLALRFLSPSYKTASKLRYRMQLDERPLGSSSDRAQFEFAQLSKGPHEIRVWASQDGENWSAQPALVRVQVPNPWWARWQTWTASLAALGIALGVALQMRQRLRLREERLRAQISMDLHDEVGAGLASVGLLGALLRDDLPVQTRVDLVDRVVSTSKELGASLRAIVWSLQPSSLCIGALGAYLEDRARSTFAALDQRDTLHIQVPPSNTSASVDLAVLRMAQLVGMEALHNAAKHAHATRVDLRLEPLDQDWLLVVQDNGVGIQEQTTTHVDSGHGLQSMARRAREVGAKLTIEAGETGGTRILLRIPTQKNWRLR
jgi:signal transduction histidine kinase